MILILSRSSDTSTDLVIDWLIKFNLPFSRINEELYDDVYVDFTNQVIKIKNLNIADIKVVWCRKYSNILNEHDKDEISKKLHKTVKWRGRI